jgi:hypothetical protein
MKQRIPELDGLRALAILAVFCHHCVGVYGKLEFLGLQHGWIGVDLFFVISGTLITTILLNLESSSKPYFSTFYSRRALRIFPLYFALLLLCFVGSIVRSTLHSPSFWVLQLSAVLQLVRVRKSGDISLNRVLGALVVVGGGAVLSLVGSRSTLGKPPHSVPGYVRRVSVQPGPALLHS